MTCRPARRTRSTSLQPGPEQPRPRARGARAEQRALGQEPHLVEVERLGEVVVGARAASPRRRSRTCRARSSRSRRRVGGAALEPREHARARRRPACGCRGTRGRTAPRRPARSAPVAVLHRGDVVAGLAQHASRGRQRIDGSSSATRIRAGVIGKAPAGRAGRARGPAARTTAARSRSARWAVRAEGGALARRARDLDARHGAPRGCGARAPGRGRGREASW